MYKYSVRDNYKRFRFKKNELKVVFFKFIFENNKNWDKEERFWIYFKYLRENPKKYSLVLAKNRCVFTSRSRSPRRIAKLSRQQFKNWGSDGYLGGISKSTW